MPVLVSFFALILIPSMAGALALSLLIWVKVLLRRFFDTAFWAKTFFPYLLWPLLMFSGLAYLGRMAFLSFWYHGRRPAVIFGGFFQIGDLFDWKLGIYGEGVTYHHLRPLLYDWWIQLQNPVLVDRWLEEQNKSLFFRWGSFFRYFFLGIYCSFGALARGFRRVISTFFAGEFGHSVLLFVFFLGKLLWPALSALLWFGSQCWSRFTYALGGETVASAFFRFARLDPLVRYQWHQRSNVDTSDYTPEAIHQKPLPLSLLRTLWYGLRRLFSWFRGQCRPLFSHSGPLLSLFGLVLLGLLLFPLGFFSGLFFLGLRWTFTLHTFYYGFLQKILDSSFDGSQKMALFLLWTGYSLLLFLSRVSFWGVHFLLALGRSLLRWAPFFIAALFTAWLSVGTDYNLSLFSFGFGTILLDFFEHLLAAFGLLPLEDPLVRLPTVSNTLHLLDLHEDWMDPQLYYPWGPFGFPMRARWSIMKMDSKPLLTSATMFDPAVTLHGRFLDWLENFLLERAWEARVAQRYALMFSIEWWMMMEDYENWVELLYAQPFDGIYYEVVQRYYGFIYGVLYLHYGFYWFFLASFHQPYLLALLVTPLPYVLFIWPLRFFLQLLRTLAQELAFVSLFLSLLLPIFSGLSLLASKLLSLGSSFLGSAKIGAGSLVSFFTSFELSPLGKIPLVAFFWAYPLRWFTWMFSLIFGDLPSHFSFIFSLEPQTQWLWDLQALLHRWWPETIVWKGFSLWSLTLWIYFQLQFLVDRLCLCAEFPRHLDDYTQFFLHRKLRRPMFLVGDFTSASIKGAFFTGHRWVLSPVHLFHYALSEPWLSLSSSFYSSETRRDYWVEPIQGKVALSQLWALAPVIVDAQRLFTLLGPFLYFLGLLLFCASFSGASSLLGDRARDQQPFYRSRQGAWDQFRRKAIQGTLQEIDKFLIYPPLDILRAVGVPMTPLVTPKAQKLFARIQEHSLAYRQLPPSTVLKPLAQKESLARGQRSFYRGLRRRLEVPLIFGEFLYSPQYRSFRGNLLNVDLGQHFLAFIAYFYSRNPEIPFCWRNYHDDDYLPWPSDLRTEIVQQLVLSGNSLSSLLEETNERLFQRQLGEWLWPQDPGNLAFFQTQSESLLGSYAYESEDQDTDAVFPWAFCGWFLYLPLCLFTNLFLHWEHPWVDDPLIIGGGTGEVYRDMLWEHNIFGHFYVFYRQIELGGWDLLPEFEGLNNPVSDVRQAPISGIRGDWKQGYYQAFYPTNIHWCFYGSREALYWGTWRPQVFFQDEGRSALRLLLLILGLRWAYGRRSSVVASALTSVPLLLWKDRWNQVRPLFSRAKVIYFGLLKYLK